MPVVGVDLGGTKVATGVFSEDGIILDRKDLQLAGSAGRQVGDLITSEIRSLLDTHTGITGIGISVPGISNRKDGTVWAPNIPGWDYYPLLKEVKNIAADIPVTIDSDRSCYILGEAWKGNAAGCTDAIFIAVGTGIGAGIIADGHVLHGSNDIAGAIGWMALQKPWRDYYIECGCFEFNASGNGIAKVARRMLAEQTGYSGVLLKMPHDSISSEDVFEAYYNNDEVAIRVIDSAIEFWGMAIANLVSVFNPQKIILGGGVFGPAVKFIPAIRDEMLKWAQPISASQVDIVPSLLGPAAGLYGAAYLAIQVSQKNERSHV